MKKKIQQTAFLLPMTELDEYYPSLRYGTLRNSKTAEAFHKLVYQTCKLRVNASFLNDPNRIQQLHIQLWVEDSPAAETVLQHLPYQELLYGAPYFDEIVNCLLKTLEQEMPKKKSIVETLYERQMAEPSEIYIHITFASFERTYLDNLYGKTAPSITKMLEERYPQYPRLQCRAFSVHPYDTCHNHMLLFFTPADLQAATESGAIAEMASLAFALVQECDVLHLLCRERYTMQVHSRRDFTQAQLFAIARS